MSQERKFLEAVFQPTFRVLGRSLLPMEVGHWLLLERLGKLLIPPCNPGSGDLALAVYVTSRPSWEAARRVARGGWMFRASIGLLTRRGAVFERGLVTWRAYVAWNLEKPVYRGNSSGGGTALNQPFWLAHLRRATSSGMTEKEALARKVKLALWESVAEQEEIGALTWCSEEEIGIQEFVRSQASAKQEVSPEKSEPETTGMEVAHA